LEPAGGPKHPGESGLSPEAKAAPRFACRRTPQQLGRHRRSSTGSQKSPAFDNRSRQWASERKSGGNVRKCAKKIISAGSAPALALRQPSLIQTTAN